MRVTTSSTAASSLRAKVCSSSEKSWAAMVLVGGRGGGVRLRAQRSGCGRLGCGSLARGLRGAQDRGKLLLVRLRVAQGGILINAAYCVLAQRLKCAARPRRVLLVPYYTLALLGLLPKTTKNNKNDAYSRLRG